MASLVGQECSHIAIPKSVLNSVVAFVLKKNSPYTNMFNHFLSILQESGQLSRMWSVWKPTSRKDCFDTGASGLGMFNMLTAFFVLGGAVLLSLAVLGCERIPLKTSKRNVRK